VRVSDKVRLLWNQWFQRVEPGSSRPGLAGSAAGAARPAGRSWPEGRFRSAANGQADGQRQPLRPVPAPPGEHVASFVEHFNAYQRGPHAYDDGVTPCWRVLEIYAEVCEIELLVPLCRNRFLEELGKRYLTARVRRGDANGTLKRLACYRLLEPKPEPKPKRARRKTTPRPSPSGGTSARPPQFGPAANVYALRPDQGSNEEAHAA